MDDQILRGDRVSFVDQKTGERVFGDFITRYDDGLYRVSCGHGGIRCVLPRDITKECG